MDCLFGSLDLYVSSSFYCFLEANDFQNLVSLNKQARQEEITKIKPFICMLLSSSYQEEDNDPEIREKIDTARNLKELRVRTIEVLESRLNLLLRFGLHSMVETNLLVRYLSLSSSCFIREIVHRPDHLNLSRRGLEIFKDPYFRPLLLNTTLFRSFLDCPKSAISMVKAEEEVSPPIDYYARFTFFQLSAFFLKNHPDHEKMVEYLFELIKDPDTKFHAARLILTFIESDMKEAEQSNLSRVMILFSDPSVMRLGLDLLGQLPIEHSLRLALLRNLVLLGCSYFSTSDPWVRPWQEDSDSTKVIVFSCMIEMLQHLSLSEKKQVMDIFLHSIAIESIPVSAQTLLLGAIELERIYSDSSSNAFNFHHHHPKF